MSRQVKTILFDCDGVLADFVTGLCQGLRAKGHETTPEDFKHWELSASLCAQRASHVPEIVGMPGFCRNLPLHDEAALVAIARRLGARTLCLTSPWNSDTWITERIAWLTPHFDRTDIIFCPSKHKARVEGDILVEDHPGNCVAWLDEDLDRVAILIDRPWNRPSSNEYSPHPRMVRAFSLSHATTLLEQFL